MSNISVDRLRQISGRRRSADWFACATKSPDAVNEPTTSWLTSRLFHTIDCLGATFIFSGIDPRGLVVGGYGRFTGEVHRAPAVYGTCAAVDIPQGPNTWVNASATPGNIVSRYSVPTSVGQGYLVGGFRKGTNFTGSTPRSGSHQRAHVIYQAAHDFSFTLNPHAVWSCGFSSSAGGPFHWFGISETGSSSIRRNSRDMSMPGIEGTVFHRMR